MNRSRILIFLIAIIGLGALGLVGYQRLSASAQSTPISAQIAKVKEDTVSAEGNVVPKSASDLAFRTGGRVAEVLISEGDMVKRGQPLIRLQDDELRIAVGGRGTHERLRCAQCRFGGSDLFRACALFDLRELRLRQIERSLRLRDRDP